MMRIAVIDHTLTTSMGAGRAAHVHALQEGRSGLRLQRFETAEFEAWLGLVEGLDTVALPAELTDFDCRNNRLAWMGLSADGFTNQARAAVARHGAHRVGVIVGTSTSGILQTEQAYRHRDPDSGALLGSLNYRQTHNTASVARFTAAALGADGPVFVVSTACSSGAKVYASAARLLALGVIDAAVVGGVDSLCLTTLYGFRALELLSADVCRPWDLHRSGLSLGEGAAFALLERSSPSPVAWLRGAGESSDGFHMSSPHPDGAGAVQAMRAALVQAGLDAAQVDYVNLHGTATPNNDAAEDRAVCQVFGQVACSSTKGATGHTLGAAGAVEAGLSMLALSQGLVPGGQTLNEPDPALHANYVRSNHRSTLGAVASNSFGFGGSNACLIFGAAA